MYNVTFPIIHHSPAEEQEKEEDGDKEQSVRREKPVVRPEEIPPVPENRFLLRRDAPVPEANPNMSVPDSHSPREKLRLLLKGVARFLGALWLHLILFVDVCVLWAWLDYFHSQFIVFSVFDNYSITQIFHTAIYVWFLQH